MDENNKEFPVIFQCHENELIGMIHQPANTSKLGVLLVVGGPQYRVGSHRQFVLLARMLAENGILVMRFDYRGMGDSSGDSRTFASVDDDITAAISAFYDACLDLSGIVIWGLCDAASAALFYAYQDERVRGLVLLNPWVYTEKGAATVYLKHYYWNRLVNPDFWRKVITLKFDYFESFASLLAICKQVFTKSDTKKTIAGIFDKNQVVQVDPNLSLPIRMRECLSRFKYPVLLILSGKDLTADEFRDAVAADAKWQSLLADARITRHDFTESDHTFSSAVWRDQVANWTHSWLNDLSQTH